MKSIDLNYQRLQEEEYGIENIFRPQEYEWWGDWEGRALLAFCCHYEMNGREIPCMHQMMRMLKERTNGQYYFGKPFDGVTVDEQQLSGHSWYLRGLLKYAALFGDEFAMQAAKSTVENLYLPALGWYNRYPLDRETGTGGVSGSSVSVRNGWKLSSDVGCAFMCVDGLAHYYEATKEERVREFLDGILTVFDWIDYVKIGFQTHTTLSCARGILTLYKTTGERKYLEKAVGIFENYVRYGMTLTYENFNWFGREDTWTEPCAVVDSFILATRLYACTKEEKYRTLARRIWFNGLQFCQRENGGAGPNTCVTKTQPILEISMYEAPFCCTMRYAEGLLEYARNESLFSWNEKAETLTDEVGRKFVDDKMLVKRNGEITPIFSCRGIEKSEALSIRLNVLFEE